MAEGIPALNCKVYIRNLAGDTDLKFENLYTITPPDGSPNEIDDTTLEDTSEVVVYGIDRYGSMSLSKRYNETAEDAMVELATAFDDKLQRRITWVLPNGKAIYFNAVTPTNPIFPSEGLEVDSILRKAVTLRVVSKPQEDAAFTPLTGV